MAAIKLEQFGGQLPAWDPHLLPVGQATFSENAYLFAGSLQGWRKPKLLHTLTSPSARMVYRIPTLTQTQALAYLCFKALPTDGDTVTVGDQTYTFRTVVSAPFDVLIGATTATTALYFAQALTADSGDNTNAGSHYGTNTPLNGDVKYYPTGTNVLPGLSDPQVSVSSIGGTDYYLVLVGAEDFGAAYNLIKVAASTAVRLTWLYDDQDFTHTTSTFRGGTNTSFDASITSASTWLEFDDPDTNVFRALNSDDEWNRYYFASPSKPPEYNTYDRIVAGSDPWLLGVPAPGCAPTLSVTGGGNTVELGNVTAGTSVVFNGSNVVLVTKITTDGATQLDQMTFVTDATQAALPTNRFAAVLYSDLAGVPNTLLATGTIITGILTGTNVSAFVNPPGLEPSTSYWIGIIVDSALAYVSGPVAATSNISRWANVFTNGPDTIAPAATAGLPGIQMFGDFLTSDILESRSYVYTWVSEYGEEGPPSPPALLDGWSNGVWTVGLWSPPADDIGVLRNLKKLNIYRTVPGSGGTTVFFYVDTLDIGIDNYVDTKDDATVALNDQLSTTNWFPPPTALQGFTVLQNGMVAGFTKNEIWFCEPYHPHAWPPGYVLTVDFPIVGLGVAGGSLVACTSSVPTIMSGVAPTQMTQSKGSEANPCSSRASILSGGNAVSYMSPNGLIQVTPSGVATNTTDLWFTREKWQQLTSQKYARAVYLASCYFCFGSVSPDGLDTSEAQRGFTIALDQDNASFTIWPQPGGHRIGFGTMDSPTDADIQNVLTDPWTGTGLLVSSGGVYYYDFNDTSPELQVYTWKSKLYQQNALRNYAATKVYFTIPPNTPTQDEDRIEEVATSSVWDTLPTGSYGFIKTLCDVDGTGAMAVVDVREIRKPGEVLRIVDGFKASHWQWEIMARVTISNVQIATSVKELAKV